MGLSHGPNVYHIRCSWHPSKTASSVFLTTAISGHAAFYGYVHSSSLYLKKTACYSMGPDKAFHRFSLKESTTMTKWWQKANWDELWKTSWSGTKRKAKLFTPFKSCNRCSYTKVVQKDVSILLSPSFHIKLTQASSSSFEWVLQTTARPHWISGQVLNSHSIVSSFRTVRSCSPWGGRWIGHWRTTWSTVCSSEPYPICESRRGNVRHRCGGG